MIGQKSQFLYSKHKQKEIQTKTWFGAGVTVSGFVDLQDSEVPVHIFYKTQLSKEGLTDY